MSSLPTVDHRGTIGARRRLPVGRLVTAALLVSSCIIAASTTSWAAGSSPNGRLTALGGELRQLVAMPGGPPGALALVQRGNRVEVVTSGVADVATRRAMASDDIIRIASISKAFSGAVALSLVSKKKLSLSDTIGQRLGTLPEAWHSVTLAELLHHTSGLPDYIKNPQFLAAFTADPQMTLTPAQLLGYVADQPLLFRPGSRYDYSDSDNIVVGLMVESVTNGSYSSALADYVTARLHLPDTTLPTTTALSQPYVHGYDVEPGKAPEDISMLINPGLAWASGGMVSTPAELNTFVRAYVGGALFNRATRTRQFSFVPGSSGPPGPGTNAAGLGVYRYRTGCGTVYGHTGNLPGYTLFAASNRDGEDSAVVVINEQLNSNPVTSAFTRLRQSEEQAVCAALGS